NTWGLGLSEDNLIFGSTANGNASMYMPIPNRYYESVNGWSASVLGTIAESQRFYPITDKVRQVDYHGRYTAGAGSAIYTPRDFQTGKGAAYETPLRDKTHGRIYRIAYVAASRKSAPDYRSTLGLPLEKSAALFQDAATGQKLVAALKNDNMLWRMHAQRL